MRPAITSLVALTLALVACGGDGVPTSSGTSASSGNTGGGGSAATTAASTGGAGGAGGEAPFDCSAGFIPVVAEPPTVLASCQTISTPGTYTLADDLIADAECLRFEGVEGVLLDCGGARITSVMSNALVLQGVTRFEIKNCALTGQSYFPVVKIADSSDGAIHGDKIDGWYIDVATSKELHLYENDMHTVYQQNYTDDTTIACNTMKNPRVAPDVAPAVIISNFGSRNVIRKNELDGAWDSMPNQYGSDDGIVLSYESDDEIIDNDIHDNWDCGIENVGFIVDSTFAKNRITNSGFCGIGGWYFSSMSNVVISDNVIDKAPRMFVYWRIYGLQSGEAAVLFENNKFVSNRFLNQLDLANPSSTMRVYSHLDFNGDPGMTGTVPTDDQYHLKNNVFEKNDFGPGAAPDFGGPTVPGYVMDGGGNHCGAEPSANYPLECAP